jgi:toxin ParE1/3/4
MPRVTRRPQAETDVIDIWIYTAQDSLVQADRWVEQLDERLQLWATQPQIGRPRDELYPGLRSMVFGRYIVFFTPSQDGIDVVRVLHSARDIDTNFN